VSHDRALLRSVCDSFLLVADGKVVEFDGDVDDYLAWLAARREQKVAPPAPAVETKRGRRDGRDSARKNNAPPRRRELEKEAEKLDRDLEKWNTEKLGLDTRLADPGLYQSASTADLRALAQRQTELTERIEAAEQRWLDIHSQLDALNVEQKI
jgi:ATP-binding cassette subfamily F protein 3